MMELLNHFNISVISAHLHYYIFEYGSRSLALFNHSLQDIFLVDRRISLEEFSLLQLSNSLQNLISDLVMWE